MSDPYGPPPGQQPGPAGVSSDDKTWALAAHIGSLVTAWFALGLIAPLLVMLVKGDSPFVRAHAVESLNFQISMLIYSIVGGVLAFLVIILTLGIGAIIVVPLVLIALLIVLVLVIIATTKAANGEFYEYPLTMRLVK
ncbi:MAG: DUF4870 domain-containing protein [Nocardioides sp.]